MNYRKKNYRGKRGYSGRPHRRTADSYHQPLPPDTNRIPYARHTLTKPDVEAVVDALLSGTLSQGRELERFESLLAKLTHSEFAIAFSSGTAAIHSALACLKLEPEDEVIVPTLTFCSVANMVQLVGARVVLADCDPETHTLSLEATRAAITENTKAVFTNNFGGHPSDLQGLRELCDEHNLLLLEDASHGLGGKYRGHYVGNQADLTCFSFHPSKAITTCEGGAVTTNNRAIAEWMRQFRHHGIQKDPRFFKSDEKLPDFYQELQFGGMNYRMSEIHAALGRSQLTRLDRHIDRRRSIAQVYHQKLGAVSSLRLPFVCDWADSAYHIFPIEFVGPLEGHRDEIYAALKEAGIDVQVHYVPLHRMPLFASEWKADQFPNAETYFSRCLTLPLFCDFSFKDLERVTDLLLKIIKDILGEAPEEDDGYEAEMAGRAETRAERPNHDARDARSEDEDDSDDDGDDSDDDDGFTIPEAPPEEPVFMPAPREFDSKHGTRTESPSRKDKPEAKPAAAPVAKEKPADVDAEAKAEESDDQEEKPKRTTRKRTTRSRTKKDEGDAEGSDGDADDDDKDSKPARARTGRPRKSAAKPKAKAEEGDGDGDGDEPKKPARRRTTRTKKTATDTASSGDAEGDD